MKRTPLRRVSRKRQALQPAYNEFRQTILERDGGCQFWDKAWFSPFVEPVASLVGCPQWCSGSLVVHHIIPRSVWPSGLMVESNVVTLCAGHHGWVHDNEAKAHTIGLHGYGYQVPK